jgi:hypothetical protein
MNIKLGNGTFGDDLLKHLLDNDVSHMERQKILHDAEDKLHNVARMRFAPNLKIEESKIAGIDTSEIYPDTVAVGIFNQSSETFTKTLHVTLMFKDEYDALVNANYNNDDSRIIK